MWTSPLSDRLKTKNLLRNPKKAKAINNEVVEFVAFDDVFLSLNMRIHTLRCSIMMMWFVPVFDPLNSYGNILNILLQVSFPAVWTHTLTKFLKPQLDFI